MLNNWETGREWMNKFIYFFEIVFWSSKRKKKEREKKRKMKYFLKFIYGNGNTCLYLQYRVISKCVYCYLGQIICQKLIKLMNKILSIMLCDKLEALRHKWKSASKTQIMWSLGLVTCWIMVVKNNKNRGSKEMTEK